MDKATSLIRCNQWAQIIRERNRSGQTKLSWCKEHGAPIKSFYYYQKKFRTQIAQEVGIVPDDTGFEEVNVMSSETSHGNIIMNTQNFQVSIPGNISQESLKDNRGDIDSYMILMNGATPSYGTRKPKAVNLLMTALDSCT